MTDEPKVMIVDDDVGEVTSLTVRKALIDNGYDVIIADTQKLKENKFMDANPIAIDEITEDEIVSEKETKTMISQALGTKSLGRMEGESFEDYKERRKISKIITKFKLRGNVVWNSYNKGTYRKLK